MTAPTAVNPLEEFIVRFGFPAGERGPEMLAEEVFGVTPDEWQRRALRAYGRRERRISIRSCHGPGKTALLAWISWHHLLTRYPQKTAVTAPTSGQLFDAYYAEMGKWHTRLPPPLRELFEIKKDRIELKIARKESFLTAKTARPELPEALQGVHSDNVLLIVDEASGVPEQIFEAASGSMSGHSATTVLASNPVRTSGLFFDTHHKLKHMWYTEHISAEDSPRVSQDFIDDIALRYGVESNAYRVRVLGEFPRSDLDTIIAYENVIAAQDRDIAEDPHVIPVWGLDVARFGDDLTALCKRYGNVLREVPRTWRHLDMMQVAGVVKAEWDSCRPSERPSAILVDAIGLGAGVVDRLREMGLPARGVNVSETKSLVSDRYSNLRTELWFMAREFFTRRDCRVPKPSVDRQSGKLNDDFTQELVSTKYKVIDSSGKLRAESKDEQKKRGLHSPNRADAFILTFAGTAASALHGRSDRQTWNRAIKRGIKRV